MTNSIKNFKIPEKFVLFGHTYTVALDPDLYEKEACYGLADEDYKIIRLQSKKTLTCSREITNIAGETKTVDVYFDLTDEMLVETFFHEVIHIILSAVGQNELSENEMFVNIVAKAVLEVYLTSDR
jgi:hypothetical protein